jgi:hypothetical protein
MSARRYRRRGFTLWAVIATMPLAALLLALLGKLVVDGIYLQRVATQHANLVATGDALTRQLRLDTWATVAWQRTEDTLTLQTVGPDGPATVTYTLGEDFVRRTASTEAEREWRCWRLRFGWRVETGPRGAVLWLELREALPPRATAVRPRTYTTTFLLPKRAMAAPQEGRDEP